MNEAPAPPASPPLSGNGARAHRRRWLRPTLVILGLVVVATTLRLTVLAPDPVRVSVAAAMIGTVEETVTNTRAGTVKARKRANLSPETSGRVVALPYPKGARVAEGAVVLRLDDSMQRAQLDLAEQDVRAAAARVDETCLAADLAAKELVRGKELAAQGINSPQALERLESESERGQAACRAARATLDQARARQRLAAQELARTQLRAPFAGVVADIHTEIGEWITPSPPGVPLPPVVEILDPTSLYVTAPIDEMDAERVRSTQAVRLSVDSRRGEHFAGHLVRIAPYVQDVVEQNRTLEVEAEFDDPRVAATLFPGTSADVEIIVSQRSDVLQIPTSAISQGDEVLVLEDGRLVDHRVKIGLRNWRTTEIVDGLEAGDQVVVTRDSPDIKAGARAVVGEAL
jgi:HlyD family secretion protein